MITILWYLQAQAVSLLTVGHNTVDGWYERAFTLAACGLEFLPQYINFIPFNAPSHMYFYLLYTILCH